MDPAQSDIEHPDLANRLGLELYRERVARQNTPINPNGDTGPRRISQSLKHKVIHAALSLSGFRQRTAYNFQNIRLVENVLPIANLPTVFDGFRILQIADLHLDLAPRTLTPAVLSALNDLEYDLCVNTGDYVARHSEWPLALKEFQKISAAIHAPQYGVLGNHDFIGQVPGLEAAGLRILLNEGVAIEREDALLWIAGVDDPHYFKTNDLNCALNGLPASPRPPVILLAHAPSFAEDAATDGRVDVFLCGHTHGGQICLPGGIPVVTHNCCPRSRNRGSWRVGNMLGYTSPGTGSSGVAARLNCPPEITRHTLRRT